MVSRNDASLELVYAAVTLMTPFVLIYFLSLFCRRFVFASRLDSGLVGHVTMTKQTEGAVAGEAGGIGPRVSAPTPFVH